MHFYSAQKDETFAKNFREYQEMLKNNAEVKKWANVKFITCCVDSDFTQAQFEQFWKEKSDVWPGLSQFAINVTGSDCKILQEFKPKSLPHCVLIDTEGQIVWKGHPDTQEIEADISDLLNNEKLFGVEDTYLDPEQPINYENKTIEMQEKKIQSFFKTTSKLLKE